jgi:hypothetical protein
VRKKGARVADFMHEHGVDIVIAGHAGEGACSGQTCMELTSNWLPILVIQFKMLLRRHSLAPRDVGPGLVYSGKRTHVVLVSYFSSIADEYLI